MNKLEFKRGIEKIELAYSTKFTKEKLELWYSKLKDMDYLKYITRIENLIDTKQYIPSIAEIKETTARAFANYEQRELTDIDFNNLYVNKQYIGE